MQTNTKKVASHLLKFGIYWLAATCFMIGVWLSRKFGDASFEQIVYHVQFGINGLARTDPILLISFMKSAVLAPFLFALGLFGIEKSILYAHKHNTQNTPPLSLFNKIYQNFISIAYKLIKFRIDLILLIIAVIFLLTKLSLFQYLRSMQGEDFLVENYIEPSSINLKISDKHNLIIIYVESLENHFSNAQIFGENLLADLDINDSNWSSFSDFEQLPGTGWTIAGVVATQCGIPLRPGIMTDNTFGERVKKFLPNVICLGDILKNNGYANFFIQGSDAHFAGTRKFVAEHGYDYVYDKETFLQLGFDLTSSHSWEGGLHDQPLLDFAKEIIIEQETKGEPYTLSIMTIDTHMPNGTPSADCEYLNLPSLQRAVRCTSQALKSFIDFFEAGNFSNTTLIIMADHLFMTGSENEEYFSSGKRTLFNRFISSQALELNRESVNHFDMYPTLLEIAGLDIENGRLALGYSGINTINLIEYQSFRQNLAENGMNYSPKYLSFWKSNPE
jgi:phosphoglycerol transferase